jgi:phosphoglycolate phosphatase
MKGLADALFFDFDGVIVDSRAAIGTCVDAVLIERGMQPVSSETLDELIGPPLTEGFASVLASRGADPALAVQCVRDFRERYARVSLEQTTLQPGMRDVLSAVAERVPIALASSKLLSLAEPLLDLLGIRKLFAAIAAPTPERDGESKTETLRHAVALLNRMQKRPLDPARAVMVGDRRHDVAAGKALGMRTVGVTWGCGSPDELRASGADWIAFTPAQLVAILLDGAYSMRLAP